MARLDYVFIYLPLRVPSIATHLCAHHLTTTTSSPPTLEEEEHAKIVFLAAQKVWDLVKLTNVDDMRSGSQYPAKASMLGPNL